MTNAQFDSVAYHEAGHAVLAHFLCTGLQSVTIASDHESAGHTLSVDESDPDVEGLYLTANDAFWQRKAIVLYAGAEAVRHKWPRSRWKLGAGNDYHWAAIALEKITIDAQQFSQGGFSMPPGAMFGAQQVAIQSGLNKNSSVNRDIALKRADMYVNARKFAIEQGAVAVRVLLDLQKTIIDQFNTKVALYNSQISKYRADIEGKMEVIRSNVAIFQADVSAFAATLTGISHAYDLMIQQAKLDNDWNVEVMKSTMDSVRFKLQQKGDGVKLRLAASEFGATFYANTIAAALGSIGTIASVTSAA